MDWLIGIFQSATRFLRFVFAKLLPQLIGSPGSGGNPFPDPGPRPIIRVFNVAHTDCQQAWVSGTSTVAITYDVVPSTDPASQPITSIKIFRVYTVGAEPFIESPPTWAPTKRLATGEYFELVFERPSGRNRTVELSRLLSDPRGPVGDAGLQPGRHWGHTLFYRQYRIVVQTPSYTIERRSPVLFGPGPAWDNDGVGSSVWVHRPAVAETATDGEIRTADFEVYLDNVGAAQATVDGDFDCSIAYADHAPPAAIDPDTGGETHQVVATVSFAATWFAHIGNYTAFNFEGFPHPECPAGTAAIRSVPFMNGWAPEDGM